MVCHYLLVELSPLFYIIHIGQLVKHNLIFCLLIRLTKCERHFFLLSIYHWYSNTVFNCLLYDMRSMQYLLLCISMRLLRWTWRWDFMPARALCSLPKLWKYFEQAAGSMPQVYVNLLHISLDSNSANSLTSKLSVMLATCSKVNKS